MRLLHTCWLAVVMTFFQFGCSSMPDTGEKKGHRYLKCAARISAAQDTEAKGEGWSLSVEDSIARISIRPAGESVVLGALAGPVTPGPAADANIQKALAAFREMGVHAVVFAGGAGKTAQDISWTLSRLVRTRVPVLVIPGAGESYDDFSSVVDEIRESSENLVDMSRVRRADFGSLSIVSIPGWHEVHNLAAGERACSFTRADLKPLEKLIRKAPSPVLLFAAAPPRDTGENGVDRALGGANAGSEEIADLIVKESVGFGIFSGIADSAGHASTLSGSPADGIMESAWHSRAFINAGTVDAVPVTTVDGSVSLGLYTIVEVDGRKMRFSIHWL